MGSLDLRVNDRSIGDAETGWGRDPMGAKDATLLRRLVATKDLPTLPQVVHLTLSKAKEERSNAEDVADIIAEDPAMTAHVLKIANSVLYNPSTRKITSVKQALARIGFEEVQRIVIAIGVIDLFRKSRIPFNYQRFWRHCIATALYSDLLSRQLVGSAANAPDPDSCFVAGLLHDIGMLPLADQLGGRYGRLVETFVRQDKSFEKYESERLGVSHHEVGGILIRRWSLADEISAAAEFHHDPAHANERDATMCRVVHIADWLADTAGYGFTSDGPSIPASEEAWCKLALTPADAAGLHDEFEQAAEDSKLFYLFQ